MRTGTMQPAFPTRAKGAGDITLLVSEIVLFPGDTRGEVHATLDCALMGILDFVGDDGPGGSRPRHIRKKKKYP